VGGNFFPPLPGPWASYEEIGHYLFLPPSHNDPDFTGVPSLTANLWFNPQPATLDFGGVVFLAISGMGPKNIISLFDFAEAYQGTYFGVSTAANSKIYTTDVHGNPLRFPTGGISITYRIIQ